MKYFFGERVVKQENKIKRNALMKSVLKTFVLISCFLMPQQGLANDDMSGAYGNSLQMDTPIGVVNLYFEPDGTYANDKNGAGTWTLLNGELCLSPNNGLPACIPFEGGHVVGDEWLVSTPESGHQVYRIVAGR